MSIGRTAVGRLGRTPETRVRWVLRFVALDLSRLSDMAWRRAWDGLFTLQSGFRVRVPPPRSRWPVERTQEVLRGYIDAHVKGRDYTLQVPDLLWSLTPPTRRLRGARRSAPITRWSAEREMSRDPDAVASTIVFAFVDDLNDVGADRLRACQLETDGHVCGVVFLATRRQIFCGPRHAQAAAWKAYEPKRKLLR